MITEIIVRDQWTSIGATQMIISNPNKNRTIYVTTDNSMKTGIPIAPERAKEFRETSTLYVKGNLDADTIVVLDDNL